MPMSLSEAARWGEAARNYDPDSVPVRGFIRVAAWRAHLHRAASKPDGTPSVCVTYEPAYGMVAAKPIREWLCPEHGSRGGKKLETFCEEHGIRTVPKTCAQLLAHFSRGLPPPPAILILGHRADPFPHIFPVRAHEIASVDAWMRESPWPGGDPDRWDDDDDDWPDIGGLEF